VYSPDGGVPRANHEARMWRRRAPAAAAAAAAAGGGERKAEPRQ
jgi:hypothetical protein